MGEVFIVEVLSCEACSLAPALTKDDIAIAAANVTVIFKPVFIGSLSN